MTATPEYPWRRTPEEFDACFASGEAFEASEDVAAEMEIFSQHRGGDQRRRVFRAARRRRSQWLTFLTKVTTQPVKTCLQPRKTSLTSSRRSTASCFGGLRASLPRPWLSSGSWLNSFAGAAVLPLPVFTERAQTATAYPRLKACSRASKSLRLNLLFSDADRRLK